MKKLLGWAQIILFSLGILFFLSPLLLVLLEGSDMVTEIGMSNSELLATGFGFVAICILFLFGIRKGIKRIKEAKEEGRLTNVAATAYPKELEIHLTGKIAYTPYRNLMLGQTFKKPVYLWVLLAMFLHTISYFTMHIQRPQYSRHFRVM